VNLVKKIDFPPVDAVYYPSTKHLTAGACRFFDFSRWMNLIRGEFDMTLPEKRRTMILIITAGR
jgi:hypothetical protein